MHNISNLFYFGTTLLHVSDGLSAHHQESETSRTASGICHTGYVAAFQASSHRTTIEMLASIIPAECNRQKCSVPLRTNCLSPTASLPAVTVCCLIHMRGEGLLVYTV
jgi:hypothetical protein